MTYINSNDGSLSLAAFTPTWPVSSYNYVKSNSFIIALTQRFPPLIDVLGAVASGPWSQAAPKIFWGFLYYAMVLKHRGMVPWIREMNSALSNPRALIGSFSKRLCKALYR